MENNLIISKIHNVFEGEFKPSILPKKNIGRHCEGFVYYLSGKAEYIFDDYSFVVDSKCFFYLAKDSIYQINVLENTKYICIDFDFCNCNDVLKSCSFKNVPANIKQDFIKAFFTWNKQSLWHEPQLFNILYKLYVNAIKSENKEYVKKNEIFSKITDIIFEHYTEPDFTVKTLASHMELSEVHLRRIFKSVVNTSPIRYINHLRLEKAKNMLISSNYTIAEIAISSGFTDPYYFSRFFKKELGISPSEYIKAKLEKGYPNTLEDIT